MINKLIKHEVGISTEDINGEYLSISFYEDGNHLELNRIRINMDQVDDLILTLKEIKMTELEKLISSTLNVEQLKNDLIRVENNLYQINVELSAWNLNEHERNTLLDEQNKYEKQKAELEYFIEQLGE